ncbi:hypothetical protein RFF05_13165 [Bengtsoniella intestinalis]|uniref:phosphorylase family protein n=1 Tax=Bengtsoniella intestinalis TaxID=3073143 RepID=UPI00391FBA81
MVYFQKYGFSKAQLSTFILGCPLDAVQKHVVLAPCWQPESVGILDAVPIGDGRLSIWNCMFNQRNFTYIVAGVGAGICADVVMALQETPCQKLLFIGSAGSVDETIEVGDWVVPEAMVSADGLCRYLSDDCGVDCYGQEYRPHLGMQQTLADALHGTVHRERGISVETLYSQFRHIPAFQKMGCRVLDMESAAVLKSATCAGIEASVVFCISDNALLQQSLVTVPETLTKQRKQVRQEVMPRALDGFLQI